MCQNTALWSGFPLIVYFTTGTDNWNGLSHPQAVRPEQQLGSQRRLPSVPASPAPDGRTKPPRNGEGRTKPPCNKTSPVTDTGGGWGGRGRRRGGTEAQMRRREEGVRRQSRHCCRGRSILLGLCDNQRSRERGAALTRCLNTVKGQS